MAGLPDHNRAEFMRAEEDLMGEGWIVLNPARLPDGLPEEAYMPICLAMLQAAEAVCLLHGYEDSRGAQIEYRYACYQEKLIIVQGEEKENES